MPKLTFDHAGIAQPYELEFADAAHTDAVRASLESDGWVARPNDSDGEPAAKPAPKSELNAAAKSVDIPKEN